MTQSSRVPKTPISSYKGKTQVSRRYIEYYQNWRAVPLDHQGHVEAEQEGEGQPRVHLAAPPHQLLKRQLHLLGHREPEDDNSLSRKQSFLVLRQGELFIRISKAKSLNETQRTFTKPFHPFPLCFPLARNTLQHKQILQFSCLFEFFTNSGKLSIF